MDILLQKTGKPDDVISIRRKGHASYTVNIKNHTENYIGEGVLQEYEVKDYMELLYLSVLEDEQGPDYVQINFPFFPAMIRNVKKDRESYYEFGYDFPFLHIFADMIYTSLQSETWPTRLGTFTNSEEKPVVATSVRPPTWSDDCDSTTDY
jgi:hypothetical protein